MSYDLRFEPFIPFRRAQGGIEWAAPWMVADTEGEDPIVDLAAPRPEFEGALMEFLIGLVNAAYTPDDEAAWLRSWKQPPTPQQLRDALTALPEAFTLDGDGPRAFQDRSAADLSDKKWVRGIVELLINMNGSSEVALDTDPFAKRESVKRLSRPAAAMALITMQTYAPAGGQGHRTGLRGGGPLTTLIVPRRLDTAMQAPNEAGPVPLWHKVWANIETAAQLELRAHADSPVEPESLFPWLSATRTSDPKAGGRPTTPLHAHPLQCHFALPRRIRLEFEGSGRCDLTGKDDESTVTRYRQRNYGVQYSAWQHPLSPHYQQKTEMLPVHGQTGGIFWRDWLGLVFEREGGERQPAAVVRHFMQRRASMVPDVEFAIRAFGFDMDNMKCKGWVEARLPVLNVSDEASYARVHRFARAAAEATSLMGSALVMAVKQALFDRVEDAKGDFSDVKEELWHATEQVFYRGLRLQVDSETEAFERATMDLRTALEAAVRKAFARRCPMESIDVADYRRLIKASFFLESVMNGKNKPGRDYFEALGLPIEKEAKPTKAKSGAKARATPTGRR